MYLLREGGATGFVVAPSVGLYLLETASGAERSLPISVSPEARLHGWTADGAAVVLESLDGIQRRLTVSLVDVESGQVVSIPLPPAVRTIGWVGERPFSSETTAPTG